MKRAVRAEVREEAAEVPHTTVQAAEATADAAEASEIVQRKVQHSAAPFYLEIIKSS